MSMFATARQSIDTLDTLFQHTAHARAEFERRRQQFARPRQVQLVIAGRGLIQLRDTGTGAVLGYRPTYREALWAAQALERGANPAGDREQARELAA